MENSLFEAGFDSTIKTLIFSGRPVRVFSTPYIQNCEKNRQQEIKDLTSCGIIPRDYDLDRLEKDGKLTEEIEDQLIGRYYHFFLVQND
jgi:NAD(P)H-dependent flavin oxidoreductase YrpB (nitropropane dioxygenase family)